MTKALLEEEPIAEAMAQNEPEPVRLALNRAMHAERNSWEKTPSGRLIIAQARATGLSHRRLMASIEDGDQGR